MRFDNKKQKHLRAWLLLAVMLLPMLGSALTGCGEDPAAPTESTKSEEFTMERDVSPIPEADGLVQTLAADSMVLLKNENSCLPRRAHIQGLTLYRSAPFVPKGFYKSIIDGRILLNIWRTLSIRVFGRRG